MDSLADIIRSITIFSGLSREVVEKFTRVRPLTLGQALRIPGITPAAVALVNGYIEIFQRRSAEQTPT